MSFTFFNPSDANTLARFQGTFAGVQAGNSTVCGSAMAPTSIYNQAGYYALQDTDTGLVSLQKLGNDSLYTKQWYDQGTDNIFDFSNKNGGFDSSTLSGNMSASDIASLANG